MTREEILAMDSTELRIEVAEKIFHAKVISREGSNPPEFLLVGDKGDGWKPLSGKRWQNSYWHYSEEAAWNDCPEYGESILAAIDVLEKLKIGLIPQSSSAPDDMKYLAITEQDVRQEEIKVFAWSAPLAICRAALLTVLEATP